MSALLPGIDERPPNQAFVDVAIPVPLRQRFTYSCEPDSDLRPGMRVAVPFGRRPVAGVVLERHLRPPPKEIKVRGVLGALEDEPLFSDELLSFVLKAADYYFYPAGEALRAAAPALRKDALKNVSGKLDNKLIKGVALATKMELYARQTGKEPTKKLGARQQAVLDALADGKEHSLAALREVAPSARSVLAALEARGLVSSEEREVQSDPFFAEQVERDQPPVLTDEQRAAVDQIVPALTGEQSNAFLLQGITGSGKTEVYLHVIEQALAVGKGALVLVPEIALTPQLSSRFRARFGDAIAVLHSGLSPRARDDAWHAVRQGRIRLVIGARSAIFAPLQSLGVVVVDEEHDGSFKQEEGFRYHAREMAMLRAHRAGAVCILGSATPSIESRFRAQQGKLQRILLRKRPTGQSLPKIETVDLNRHRGSPSGHLFLSMPLQRALEETLERGEQSILFLNRRGFSPAMRCESCGEVQECPICSVSLTLHRFKNLLRCHYCDHFRPSEAGCTSCKGRDLEELGVGTEQLEDRLRDKFPDATIRRMDRDSVNARNLPGLLAEVRRGEVDILVGTQMVTKGHDLPGVTLVGVVLADHALHFPDFRAAERTFQQLSQVAGRAGRGDRPGRVIFQTYQPEHPAIAYAVRHDYERFFAYEIEERQGPGYVPHWHLAAVRVDAGDEAVARRVCTQFAETARRYMSNELLVLGPAPAPIARVRGRYRYRLLLRGRKRGILRQVVAVLAHQLDKGVAPARAHIDVDPVSML